MPGKGYRSWIRTGMIKGPVLGFPDGLLDVEVKKVPVAAILVGQAEVSLNCLTLATYWQYFSDTI